MMQLLTERYVALPWESRSTMATEHAPQSPSAQPSRGSSETGAAKKFEQGRVGGYVFEGNETAIQNKFKRLGPHTTFF